MEFFWPDLVLAFGLYLFLSVRNKAKKRKSKKQNKYWQKYCCNSLKTVVNEVAIKTSRLQ